MITFNADEVFEMAEQMERNGEKFYRTAAESLSQEDARSLLLDLAAMESDHEKTFKQMRAELSDEEKKPTVFDPDHEMALYMRAFVDGQVFDLEAGPEEFLAGGKTLSEILVKAIAAEKDAIVFYLGLREMVPERLGGERIDGIVKEEMGHISVLGNKLKAIQ